MSVPDCQPVSPPGSLWGCMNVRHPHDLIRQPTGPGWQNTSNVWSLLKLSNQLISSGCNGKVKSSIQLQTLVYNERWNSIFPNTQIIQGLFLKSSLYFHWRIRAMRGEGECCLCPGWALIWLIIFVTALSLDNKALPSHGTSQPGSMGGINIQIHMSEVWHRTRTQLILILHLNLNGRLSLNILTYPREDISSL